MIAVADLNYWLALGTVVIQVMTAVFICVYLLRSRIALFADISGSVTAWGLWAAFALSFVTLIVAEYYKILGFEACPLCWWQEIFLYPQVILFGMAAWKKDSYIAEYSIALSVFGACVALYQHVLQMLPHGSLPCPATGTVSCGTRILFEFGYVTYPLMAFALFCLLIVLMLFVRNSRSPQL